MKKTKAEMTDRERIIELERRVETLEEDAAGYRENVGVEIRTKLEEIILLLHRSGIRAFEKIDLGSDFDLEFELSLRDPDYQPRGTEEALEDLGLPPVEKRAGRARSGE